MRKLSSTEPDLDALPVNPALIVNGSDDEQRIRAIIDLKNAIRKSLGATFSKVRTVERQSRIFTTKTKRVYRKTPK